MTGFYRLLLKGLYLQNCEVKKMRKVHTCDKDLSIQDVTRNILGEWSSLYSEGGAEVLGMRLPAFSLYHQGDPVEHALPLNQGGCGNGHNQDQSRPGGGGDQRREMDRRPPHPH